MGAMRKGPLTILVTTILKTLATTMIRVTTTIPMGIMRVVAMIRVTPILKLIKAKAVMHPTCKTLPLA
jgi:hypothetical protein